MGNSDQENIKLVGVEVSATEIRAVVLSWDGGEIFSEILSIGPAVSVVEQIGSCLRNLRSSHENIGKVGIAVSGLVNREANKIIFSAHVPDNSGVDFAQHLRNEIGLETFIENDANAAAYGEYVLGAGRNCRNLFYVTLGQGVGGALVADGKIWHGTSGYAGEFGFLTINSEGVRIEEMASSANIIRRIRARFHQDNTSSLVEIGEENFTISDVVKEAIGGDNFAQMMLQRTGGYVGTGVANVINLLNVEKIILGGEILEADNYVLDAVIERARELSFEPSFKNTEIVVGKLKNMAAAMGVAILARGIN